jgi:hypothetical protein
MMLKGAFMVDTKKGVQEQIPHKVGGKKKVEEK